MGRFSDFHKTVVEENPQFQTEGNMVSSGFGKLVFMHRVRQKMSQEELAQQANLPHHVISKIEGGGGGLTDEVYARVFQVLDVNLFD